VCDFWGDVSLKTMGMSQHKLDWLFAVGKGKLRVVIGAGSSDSRHG